MLHTFFFMDGEHLRHPNVSKYSHYPHHTVLMYQHIPGHHIMLPHYLSQYVVVISISWQITTISNVHVFYMITPM